MFQALCSVLYTHSLISQHPTKWVLLCPILQKLKVSEKQTKICPSPLIYLKSAVQAGKPRPGQFPKVWYSLSAPAFSPGSRVAFSSHLSSVSSDLRKFFRLSTLRSLILLESITILPFGLDHFSRLNWSYTFWTRIPRKWCCVLLTVSYQEMGEVNLHHHQRCSFWSLG